MKLRYSKTGVETAGSEFNMSALAEVLTGDDSVSVSDLDVFITKTNEWKPLAQAFRDRDVITDNYNSHFFEPQSSEERERGYRL